MKAFVFTAFVLTYSYCGVCQTPERLVVKPGDDVDKVYNYIYRYPQFQYGKVFLINGDVSAGQVNYNILSHEMQFIDPKGDTLALANETSINFISIGADTFYHNTHGYVEQAAHLPVTILVFKEEIKATEEKIGAYGIPTSTLNIESKKVINAGENYFLSPNAIVTLSKRRQYFFSDERFNILPANSKNVMKVFTRQKEKIQHYLETNPIDFNSEPDLKKLFTYVHSIS